MIKKFIYVILLNMAAAGLFAQHMPIGINYQAVARDNAGNELKSRNLNVRISILENDPTGLVEYAETHSVTTDKFGLFSLVIGQGSWYSGEKIEFNNINWGSSPHFLKVEVDFGEGFIAMGTMQFLAVPYALYAANAGNISGEEDLDKDPQNELQFLSLEGTVLQIKNGSTVTNSVTLSDVVNDADADPENEMQDLNIDQNHKLKITKNPAASVINLEPYLDNTDNQTLSKSMNSISISGGNSVIIDVDSTNELQTLSSVEGKLSISQGNEVDIFDADADPANELQTLSSGEGKLSISNGNEVDIYDADADPSNEIQELSIDGYSLTLNKGGKTVNIRPDVIAFRAVKEAGINPISGGNSEIITFTTEKLDTKNSFEPHYGSFIVPNGGDGLYSFHLIYGYNSGHRLTILKNGEIEEGIFEGFSDVSGSQSYEFLALLTAGDKIEILLEVSINTFSGPAIFSGYRIH